MSNRGTVQGIAASSGSRRGRARVLKRSADFAAIRTGEVLVTTFTGPEVVLAFDRIAALVTEQGGRSAHAAVIARELGIPAVVGTQIATTAIADGDMVLVDGSRGIVRIDGDAEI